MARLPYLVFRHGALGLALIACLACLACLGCGDGGSSDGDTTDVAGGGISGTGISSGAITDFGSIWVNDVEFDVATAAIMVNGTAASEADLRIGQVVTVEFTGNTATGRATANRVTYARALAGPVEDVDLMNEQVRILGQWVAVDRLLAASDDNNPSLDLDLEHLEIDDTLEVSGQFDADGVLHATRMERKGHGGQHEVEVKGMVQHLTQNTFMIRDLTVDYHHAMKMPHMLSDGFLVEVKGTLDAGTMVATEVTVKEDPSPVAGSPPGTDVEIDGFITEFDRFLSHGELTVDQQRVRTTDETHFKGGATADGANLGLNVPVEVEGKVGKDGVVIADVIERDD
jgi:hypothetical protein